MIIVIFRYSKLRKDDNSYKKVHLNRIKIEAKLQRLLMLISFIILIQYKRNKKWCLTNEKPKEQMLKENNAAF